MTDESAVKVCIRVRPLLEREEIAEPAQLFWKADEKAIHQIDAGNSSKSFSFDRVFTADETTSQLYQDIAKPLVVSTVEGYNGTIFAYGQTSSGKTFTMMGGGRIPGVIPLAVEDVFQSIKNFPKKEFLLRVSYMEIYNETVTDLLVDSWKRKPLEVRETINKNIYVAELTEELITSSAQALAWIRKGEKNRHYGKTKMNQRSSRSHTIFRMILESRERSDPASGENADGAVIVSHLNLVDLAGSERASQTGAEGARFKEGCHINRSLLILGQVMKKLTDESQKGYTNYRDSKLTRILQNSLGGNAKTVIICTITPITLEETLSTLQFASTAKKMKNDPHVTEVSDDGALLKRYRNEIVDLKRRLQEVSGVTHATATEKDFLSLLLQEKDQLQREQQDRIRNLTKLLVTSSNLVLVQKMPKRRVTWGGKMLRLAHPSACDDGSSDVSFAEPFSRKRKADYLTELGEGEHDEDFDSHWGIPDEPSVDMEMSQSSGDSPKDFVSPNQLREISGKVSNLEVQLEMESQQKEEAMTKIEALDGQVAELHLQLETEEQQKQEAEEMMQTTEQRAAELQLQLQTETQQRLEAVEKVEMLEFRLTDLERQLEDHRITQTESDQQMKQDFAETIQLCESLTSEKDSVVAERDYLKQELGMFIEQMNSLEKEKAALSQDLEEKREMEEFETLEEEFRKEHENEMQHEVSSLKAAVESSELQCLELKNKLESVSEQLKTKTEFAEELQSMSGKDLVQEVATLRRSLYDAEGLSRDTKKEWAVLRSQNMALEEVNGSLTADHQQMETEVTSLRFMLDAEKSRYRQMQSDLQKELNVAFDENTKLTSLLDGKVPKDVMDSVELERKVAVLNKELTASREAAKVLRAQLASFQTLPNTVDSLTKQVCELNEELGAVQTQRDNLLCVHEDEAQQLRDSLQTSQQELSAAALRETELSQHCADVTQQLESLRSDLQRLDAERSRLTAPGEERGPEIRTLTAELERARAERDDLLSERTVDTQTSSEETETLQSRGTSLSEERDKLQETVEGLRQEKQQLRAELEDRMETLQTQIEQLQGHAQAVREQKQQLEEELQRSEEKATETQSLLQSLQEELHEQKEKTSQLEKLYEQISDSQLQIQALTEELERARAERDDLLSDQESSRQTSSEETETLQSRLMSLSDERDQLQETVEGLRQEKQQLRAELEDRMETLQTQVRDLAEKLEAVEAERHNLLSDQESSRQMSSEETETLQSRLMSLSEERDQLQETVEGLRQEKQQLRAELEDRMETLQTQVRDLAEKLEAVEAERHNLLSDQESSRQTSSEETEKLQSRLMSLSEERDQLQETVEGLRQEKQQLRTELEDRMEAISAVQDKLSCQEELNLQQRSEGGEREAELQELLQEQLKSHREGRAQAAAEAEAAQRSLRDANTTISALREQLSSSEQNAGVGETTSSRLQESARQLQELLGVFQHIIDTCAKYNFTALDEGLTQEYRLKDTQLSSLTKPTKAAYDAVCQLEQATLQSFTQIEEQLHVRAQGISSLFEQLVQKDLDVFEERRLQDLLLSRAPAASHSVTDHDLHSVWEQRLTELLDRRLLYLQKMDVISKRLRTHQGSFILELRAEVKDREKLKEQMQTLVGNQPIGCSQLDSLLRQEVNRRLATARGKMRPLQAIVEEEDGLFEELKQLQDQVDSQLREAKSKSWTLLQALEGAPLQTELSLLKDNQQLALQLQHSQHTARALHIQKEQLEEAQVKASSRISSHKQATQLLQTELQDSRALLEDQENAIQTLRSRLRELERREPPSAAELEKLQSKLFKLEVKLSSALDQHQQEVQTMTTLLSEKEASLRKLKEALRKSQQQGDESFLQGKDLHTRLTHPRGLVMKSSVMLDKTKLEKEVTQLQLKITELESLMSSQRAEISKWKNRAIKLNMKSKAEVKLSPPRTPTKRGLPMASTSFNLLSSPKKSLLTPKKMLEPCGKLLDSPKLSLLNSPKSGFFDGDGASEVLSRTCPKQFFDNSSLGTIPDGAVGVDRKEQPWPQSPKEEEMCKSQ
ncbi:centromere-associated protein E isoform X2 [Brachyistius frenatus]|uniref:centromere-associated protein E isoform X2 n=1 Tax=Brachyistius frenatus TaxID=100188 RepID=UPI0037E76FB1